MLDEVAQRKLKAPRIRKVFVFHQMFMAESCIAVAVIP